MTQVTDSVAALDVSLSTKLSRVVAAHTIELDNRWEASMIEEGLAQHVFLTSKTLWSTFLRFVEPSGATVDDVQRQSGLTKRILEIAVAGAERWGYLAVERARGQRPKPLRPEWVLHPTVVGHRARQLWEPLDDAVDAAWRDRFGTAAIEGLLDAATAALAQPQVPSHLPPFLPMVAYAGGMRSEAAPPPAGLPATAVSGVGNALARVLLAFALEAERDVAPAVTMANASNVLAALVDRPQDQALPLSEVPAACGISKAVVTVSLKQLVDGGLVESRPNPAGRGQAVVATATGREAFEDHVARVTAVETTWDAGDLHAALDGVLAQEGALGASVVATGSCWRNRKPWVAYTQAMAADPLHRLPRHPIVSHRGGYPDGS